MFFQTANRSNKQILPKPMQKHAKTGVHQLLHTLDKASEQNTLTHSCLLTCRFPSSTHADGNPNGKTFDLPDVPREIHTHEEHTGAAQRSPRCLQRRSI